MSARTKVLSQCFSNIFQWIKGAEDPKNRRQFRSGKPVSGIYEISEISEILKNSLYLSGSMPLTETKLKNLGITAVVCAMTENEENVILDPSYRRMTSIKKLPVRIIDSESSMISIYFDQIAKFIHDEIESGGKVLVHCLAGISRSPTLILAYLIRYRNFDLLDAYDFVADRRRIIEPNNSFFYQLITFEKSLKENQLKIDVKILTGQNEDSVKIETETENDEILESIEFEILPKNNLSQISE